MSLLRVARAVVYLSLERPKVQLGMWNIGENCSSKSGNRRQL